MHQHRPGSLKQSNKPYKSKYSSNRALKKKVKGRVESKQNTVSKSLRASKDLRKNQSKQKRIAKKQQEIDQKRKMIHGEVPPKVVSIISLSGDLSATTIGDQLFEEATGQSMDRELTYFVSKWKKRLSVFSCPRNLFEMISLTQISDIILFLISDQGIDEIGKETLKLIRAQGSASKLAAAQINSKIPQSTKKAVERQLSNEFGEKSFKVTDINNISEILRAICQIGEQEPPLSKSLARPFLVAETSPQKVIDEQGKETVEISGYLRGGELSADQLIHVPLFGDYQIQSIFKAIDPHPAKSTHNSMETDTEIILLSKPSEKQESLQVEFKPNPMDSEQYIPSDSEDQSMIENIEQKKKKRPKGMSSYQASWIEEEEGENFSSDEEALPMNHLSDEDDNPFLVDDDNDEKQSDSDDDDEPDTSEKRRLERDDIDFPDQVDTPEGISCKERFNRYRGLKSFRTSPWDPKEELPSDYAKIFQFKSMKQSQQVTLERHEGIGIGTFITIRLDDAPLSIIQQYANIPLTIVGLYTYERKMSVLNFLIKRATDYTEPVASKEELLFFCGFRWLVAHPIFSEHTANCDKFKYERFWHPTTASVATIYGPVMFTPTPLLIFKRIADPSQIPSSCTLIDGMVYVGSGNLLSVSPNRLVIKKITLTGEPFKIFKRKATIRKMFTYPEDVSWFKPIELRTRLGRTGNILESVGTHGKMKCLFDAQLQQNDVVLLNLYKRVFPKWASSYLTNMQSSHNLLS